MKSFNSLKRLFLGFAVSLVAISAQAYDGAAYFKIIGGVAGYDLSLDKGHITGHIYGFGRGTGSVDLKTDGQGKWTGRLGMTQVKVTSKKERNGTRVEATVLPGGFHNYFVTEKDGELQFSGSAGFGHLSSATLEKQEAAYNFSNGFVSCSLTRKDFGEFSGDTVFRSRRGFSTPRSTTLISEGELAPEWARRDLSLFTLLYVLPFNLSQE